MEYFNNKIPDNKEFLKVCEFKWCFNAKPDLVIHTRHDTAICIETKNESRLGTYPSKRSEKVIFYDRGLDPVGQLTIQKKIMDEILSIKTKNLLIVKNPRIKALIQQNGRVKKDFSHHNL